MGGLLGEDGTGLSLNAMKVKKLACGGPMGRWVD